MAAAVKFSWNAVLGLFRKFAPDRAFLRSVQDAPRDGGSVANERPEELLKRLKSGKGFESLQDVIGKFVCCKPNAEREGGVLGNTNGERLMAVVEGKALSV
jgi:hypothetical protein